MKKLILFLLCFYSFAGIAQEKTVKKIPVPLSNPGKKGKLTVELIKGSITVQAYGGKEVVVSAITYEQGKAPSKSDNGMFRIPNNSYGLEIQEKDNHVEVEAESWKRKIDFEILVPKSFDLRLKTINNGNIEVSGVGGELEISNVNGSITLNDVEGSIVSNTVNGKITATLSKVTPDIPMSFTTLNGKVDVTLPTSIKATAKIKSDYGNIYSDFDMKIEDQPIKMEKPKNGGGSKIIMDKWVVGKINGGGPELMFKNMHGDIYIRKK
ncbi:MAG: DUF4097 family beta strand repeat-containing protein [Flammeovirgaceae bacterium]